MTKLFTVFALSLVLVGAGCSYKYESEWNTQDRAWEQPSVSSSTAPTTSTTQNCVVEGQPRDINTQVCCAGLEDIALDHAFSVCGKPGTGWKPPVCVAVDQVMTIDSNNCCAGLEPTEKNGKWVCDYQK